MNSKTEEILVISLAFVILIASAFIINPSLTGYVVFAPEFSYNTSLINTTDGYSLLPTIQTTAITNTTEYASQITSAVYDGHDKTSQLQTLENGVVEADKSKILDIAFERELKNNDKIIMYVKDNQDTYIYLCPASILCSSPGYGSINYPGQEGYYTITISNLETPTNIFNIGHTAEAKIKFDYIYATYTETSSTNTTTIIYPESAALITNFIEPSNLSSFGLLEKTEELNSQSILYEYTTDDTNYNIISDFNLSYINSGKIKFRITLQSDTTNTPILKNLTLNYYTIEPPTESPKQNLTEPEKNQTANQTEQPPAGSGASSGGGGGSSAPSTIYQAESTSPAPVAQEASENKEQKVISLYEIGIPSKEPEPPKITNYVIKETPKTKYYVNAILILLLIASSFIAYRKLIHKNKKTKTR